MDFVITFFRDILDGGVYTIVTVVCSILICACIGYLAEKKQKKKQMKEQYVEVSNAVIAPDSTTNTVLSSVPPLSTPSSFVSIPSSVTTVPTGGVISSNDSLGSSHTMVGDSTIVNSGISTGSVQIGNSSVVSTVTPSLNSSISSGQVASTVPYVQPVSSFLSQDPASESAASPQPQEVPTSVNQG